MKKLRESKPVLHAVLWILLYILTVNLGTALSEFVQVPELATIPLLIALALVLVFYLKKTELLKGLRFHPVHLEDLQQTVYYGPLILLALIQFIAGINASMSGPQILRAVLLMLGIGFLEEVLFRGLLFRAIEQKSGTRRAIVISGVTFGLGHIVNLMNGYRFTDQIGQIITAVAIGLVLALLVGITRNLLPGILFHIVFNISGTITNPAPELTVNLLIGILLLSLPYAYYLYRFVLPKSSPLIPQSLGESLP